MGSNYNNKNHLNSPDSVKKQGRQNLIQRLRMGRIVISKSALMVAQFARGAITTEPKVFVDVCQMPNGRGGNT
jgi:hypothetical protein